MKKWIRYKNKQTNKNGICKEHEESTPGGVLNFELGMDVRPEVSTTTL